MGVFQAEVASFNMQKQKQLGSEKEERRPPKNLMVPLECLVQHGPHNSSMSDGR